ncbi:DotD/TraH family lipoprotein [Vibrio agarivorans]|uniref:DotD/TraH family lipoprotein n=1 Tax=Vibrio agarivorans TaxID=153622 RepID=UPI0025B4A0B8|nr:DotD/TraH family lipoprotein [Vibrio agarivorans]MDN3661077.1 DotD/TraH family lipoprotein [Vibrio agarivorans]
MRVNVKFALLAIAIINTITACSSSVAINETAPPSNQQRNLIDVELESFTQDLIDANNRLVSARKTKVDLQYEQHSKKLKPTKFSGLDINRDFDCTCDLKTALQVLSIQLGWDMNKVLEIGRKPAQGVPVSVQQRNQPLSLVLESLDMQVGHYVDIRIDPNFESILIEYKSLDAPRSTSYEIN